MRPEHATKLRFTAEDVGAARAAASRSGRSLVEELAGGTAAPPAEFVAAMAELLQLGVAEIGELHDWQPAFDLIGLSRALARNCVVFRGAGAGLVAVIDDPFDVALQQWVESACGEAVEFRLAPRSDIRAYLSRKEESARAIDTLVTDTPAEAGGRDAGASLSFVSISEDASPVVRIVNSTLYDALKAGASDIHLESTPAGINIKYRIDGVLDSVMEIAGADTAEQVISRIKVMSELDIAERRVPQDGRFRVSTGGRDIDVRVSIMPCIHGEDAVLRILDKRQLVAPGSSLRLDLLGFDESALSSLRRLAAAPYGMLLVTGPTGSGKTTTLYATISEINHGKDKIITIEDPVEYELPGVAQIPVNEKKGLTFARGLRSILRHDPDKIMVGEIRDPETAEIAVQSALTGHLVLTTVHANGVLDVFSRFSHMGVDPYALVAALNGIWAQRLVRLNCPRCSSELEPGADELATAGIDPASAGRYRFRGGRGCGDCRGMGYRGRKAIAEIMVLNDALRELIAGRAPVSAIKDAARAAGTRYLRQTALDLVRAGETTLAEANRVTLQA